MFLTENCAPRPLETSEVVIPRTSPTTYPYQQLLRVDFHQVYCENVTIPMAPDPDPVIE